MAKKKLHHRADGVVCHAALPLQEPSVPPTVKHNLILATVGVIKVKRFLFHNLTRGRISSPTKM